MNLAALTRHLATLGFDLPPELAALDAAERAVNSAASAPVVADLRAEVLGGSLTAENAAERLREAAVALVVADQARVVARELTPAWEKAARAALRGAGPRLMAAIQPAFAAAAEAIARARTELGPSPDPDAVLRSGPQAAELWRAAEESWPVVFAARHVRGALAEAGYGPSRPRASWWLEPESVRPGDLDRAERAFGGSGDGLRNLVAAGFRLCLNTPEEVAEVDARGASQSAPGGSRPDSRIARAAAVSAS